MPPGHGVPTPPSQPSGGAYPAGGAGTSGTPSSPPTGSSAAATCTSAWVSTPPVMALVSLRWSTSSLSQVRDGTHPLAARPVNPGLLPRPGRSGWHRRWVPEGWARPTDRSPDSPSGVGRFGGQAGTQASDPTPEPGQNLGTRAGSTIHILPAESARFR